MHKYIFCDFIKKKKKRIKKSINSQIIKVELKLILHCFKQIHFHFGKKFKVKSCEKNRNILIFLSRMFNIRIQF